MLLELLSLIVAGLAVNGQVISPVEANSSPSHIIATKGSSVWLHWNYTYIGDGRQGLFTVTYKEQVIGLNTTLQPTIQTLAKRTGQNGALTLESPVPAPFNGRVEVISANNTFLIHGLQYNDSTYQVSSSVSVDVDVGGGVATHNFVLKPVISVTVNGIPDFIARPPSTLDVSEGSNLQLRVEMDGNPQPSADFRWPHRTRSSPANVPSVQLYPFVYSSTYTLNNIDASYCGRILQTTLRNDIGSSADTASTYVAVLLKLDMDFRLKAGKIGSAKCVEVKWNKVESGACYVKYEIVLKSASGSVEYSDSEYNIGEMTVCRDSTYGNVTDVQLTVSFKGDSKTVTRKVFGTTVSTPSAIHEPTNPPVGQSTTVSMSTADPGTSGNATSSPRKHPDSDSTFGVIVGAIVCGFGIVFGIRFFCRRRSNEREVILNKIERAIHFGKSDMQWSMLTRKMMPGSLKLSNGTYELQGMRSGRQAADDVSPMQLQDQTYADPKKPNLINGKFSGNAADHRPRDTRNDEFSDYADVKVDEKGYPEVGAMPTSYTDGYGERSPSRGDSGRESGHRTAPNRRPPPTLH